MSVYSNLGHIFIKNNKNSEINYEGKSSASVHIGPRLTRHIFIPLLPKMNQGMCITCSFKYYRRWTNIHEYTYSFHHYQRWTKVHESYIHSTTAEDEPRTKVHEWHTHSMTTEDGQRTKVHESHIHSMTIEDGPRPRFMNHIFIPFQLKMDQGSWINIFPLQPKMDRDWGSRITCSFHFNWRWTKVHE